ncbi:zinc-regulated TonB-dependent outer membrane receptor [Halorhodospira abdelmalekii]|uniref:zinc-regulated TonB-dependent outer membrane receptor n=1 Tax=Halorhodospira abdelmalekii TaxID=421629 RepID=UPI001908A3B4|nr:zinc-regulated TonB-dependent outer membrane receptor [Halorhodospira abdelmalekii]
MTTLLVPLAATATERGDEHRAEHSAGALAEQHSGHHSGQHSEHHHSEHDAGGDGHSSSGHSSSGHSSSGELASGARFNPEVTVIFDGVYATEFSGHSRTPGGFDLPRRTAGHSHSSHAHGFTEGFQLRETEFVFQATVDPFFDAFAMLVVEDTGRIDLEEAYFTTRQLPAGLQLKGGRLLSGIGYINGRHAHSWEFVDRPWVNEYLFGHHGLQEIGVQLTWDIGDLQFGAEALQGDQDGPLTRYSGATGPHLATLFAQWAPSLEAQHSAHFGLSGGYGRSWEAAHAEREAQRWESGTSWFAGVDARYHYQPTATARGHRTITLQGEWFYRDITADYLGTQATGATESWQQDGLYVQAVYGIAPRWRAAVRAEALGLVANQAWHSGNADNGFAAFADHDASYRYALALTHQPSDASSIRSQLNYADLTAGKESIHDGSHHSDAWQFFIQYSMKWPHHPHEH